MTPSHRTETEKAALAAAALLRTHGLEVYVVRKPYFRPRVKLMVVATSSPVGLVRHSVPHVDPRWSPLYQPLGRTKAGGLSWDGWGRPPEGFLP